MKFITLATVLATVVVETVICQTPTSSTSGAPTYVPQNNFPWKNTYPAPLTVPEPKAEWLQLIKTDTVPKAPISQKGPDGALVPPAPGGADPFCHWSFTQCLKETDVMSCQKGNWAPTYDDGPTPVSAKLYDYLKQNNIKATFFVIGGNVIQYPDLLKRLHDEGHEIGIHTWSHQLLTSQTNEQIIAELKWTELAIKEVIGVSPRFMRPPYGDMDDRVRDIVKQLGFIPVIWNHDTFDWKLQSNAITAAEIDQTINKWITEAPTAAIGGISLEHDVTQTGVDIAIKTLPLLKNAYNLTVASQCGNISHEAIYKETMNQASSNPSDKKNAGGNSGASGLVVKSGFMLTVMGMVMFFM
ncbi:hypothetical protein BJ944DRAFT_267410 [Cunninghamella echinulata]|nr:hypothetical protein BJ944DRAFT_267410 [Cunninghamella echinulata]